MAPKVEKPVRPAFVGVGGQRLSPQNRFDAYLSDKMHSISNQESPTYRPHPDAGSAKCVVEKFRPGGGSACAPVVLANPKTPTIDELVTDIVRGATMGRASTLNRRAVFVVEELQYPGTTTQAPIGQYVYVFGAGGRLLVEALCGEQGWEHGVCDGRVEWYYRLNTGAALEKMLTHETPGVLRSKGVLPVPGMKPKDKIAFFLSPVPLTPAARDRISKHVGSLDAKKHGCVVRPVWGKTGGYVAISEPTKWAEAAHEQWFLRELGRYRVWRRRRDDDLFFASVLHTWEKPLSLGGELRESVAPDDVRKRQELEEKKYLASLGEALGYCLNALDTHEHSAVELASQGRVESLFWMLTHWSKVLPGLVQLPAGRKFIDQLVRGIGAGQGRMPYRLIKENWPSFLSFEQRRYLAIAADDALAVLLPYTMANTQGAGFIQRTKNVLKRVGTWEGLWPSWNPGAKQGTHAWPRAADTIALDVIDAPHQPWRERLDRHRERSTAGAFILLEVMNFFNAIEQHRKNQKLGNDDWVSKLSGMGAYADLAATLVKSVDVWRKKPVVGFSRVSAALMLAGSVADTAEFAKQGGVAVAEEDWSSLVGSSIAQIGTGMNAIAGASLAIMGSSWALFVAAPYLMALGGVLVALGSLIGRKGSPYQEFAEHCRFGNKSGKQIYRRWAHATLGTSSRSDETKALVGMMCAYSLEVLPGHDTASDFRFVGNEKTGDAVVIRPGYIPPQARFEVSLKLIKRDPRVDYKAHDPHGEARSVSFQVRPTDPPSATIQSIKKTVSRDQNGQVSSIAFYSSLPELIESATVYLVIEPRRFQVPAENGSQLAGRNVGRFSTFEVDAWESQPTGNRVSVGSP